MYPAGVQTVTTNSVPNSWFADIDNGGAVKARILISRGVAFDFLGDTPALASETMRGLVFAEAMSFPGNFAGSVGSILVLPTVSSFVAIIEHNGVQIGTMTVSTAGVFTFATNGGAPVNCAIGDTLTFIAPSSVNATAANFLWTLMRLT